MPSKRKKQRKNRSSRVSADPKTTVESSKKAQEETMADADVGQARRYSIDWPALPKPSPQGITPKASNYCTKNPVGERRDENCSGNPVQTVKLPEKGANASTPADLQASSPCVPLQKTPGPADDDLQVLEESVCAPASERLTNGCHQPFPLCSVDRPLEQQQGQAPLAMLQTDEYAKWTHSTSQLTARAPVSPNYSSSDDAESVVSYHPAHSMFVRHFEEVPWIQRERNHPLSRGTFQDDSNLQRNFRSPHVVVPPHENEREREEDAASTDSTSGNVSQERAIVRKPAIVVAPWRRTNLAAFYVPFWIMPINFPDCVKLSTAMLEAVAVSPSGVPIDTEIQAVGTNPVRSPDLFTGSFLATREVGMYTVRVRVTLPLALCVTRSMLDCGVVSSSTDILVGMNYYQKSQLVPGVRMQLSRRMREPRLQGNAWGIACDTETNRLYYTERTNKRVSCLDPHTRKIIFQTSGGRVLLKQPSGVCFDHYNRRVLVCDKGNHRIRIFSTDGKFISSFGGFGWQNGELWEPWDVDVSPSGNRIVVADSRNKRVQLFDRFGNFLAKFPVFETHLARRTSKLDYPLSICFNSQGNLIYVTDFNNQNIVEMPLSLTASRNVCLQGVLKRPQGIVCDPLGNLLVCDSMNNALRYVSEEGVLLHTIRTVGNRKLVGPVNLTLLRGGHVALLDSSGKLDIF